HIPEPDAAALQAPFDRAAFAAACAEELLTAGVRCVVIAGWVVKAVPATAFAETFYQVILQGGRFADAVAKARGAAFRADRDGSTWAAYQCYGDPGWTWRRAASEPSYSSVSDVDIY